MMGRDANAYKVTVTAAPSGNFRDEAGATWTIAPARIIITAENKTSRYGEALEALTWEVGGDYVAGDALGIIARTDAKPISDVDVYPITLDWNGNPNYTARLVNGRYTITGITLTVTVTGYSGVYDGRAHGITVDVGNSGAQVYYGLTELTANNYSTAGSAMRPAPTWTDAGEYTVYYYVVADHYEPSYARGKQTVTITRAKATATAPTAVSGLVYRPSAQTLVSAGSTADGTMQYALSKDGPFAPALPTGTNAGSYAVYYKVAGDKNHTDSAVGGPVNVTIARAAASVTAPTAKTLTWTGNPQALVNAGAATGGTLQYSTDGKTWSTAIPTATDAGGYAVYYRVVGDDNHSDIEPRKLTVTIAPKPTEAPTVTPEPTVMPEPTATPMPTARPTDPDFTLLAKLMPAGTGGTGLKLTWTKVGGADGYDIFFARCGKTLKYKATVNGSGTLRYRFAKLKKGEPYKAYVRAWKRVNGVKTYIGKPSPTVHAIASGFNSKIAMPVPSRSKRPAWC